MYFQQIGDGVKISWAGTLDLSITRNVNGPYSSPEGSDLRTFQNYSWIAGHYDTLAGSSAGVVLTVSGVENQYAESVAGAFTGNLSNSGSGIMLNGNGATVIRTFSYGNSAPWPVGGSFSGFAAPSLNNTGTLAYFKFGAGILTKNGTTVTTIAGFDGTFSNYGDPTINAGGTVAYTGNFIDGGMGLFTGNGTTTTTVSNTNTSAFSFFGEPSINTSGTVAFIGTLKNFNGAIYKNDGTTLTLIAQSSLSLPYRNFNFSKPSINSAGLVAFRAGLNPSAEGLFVSDGITDTKVILVGDALFGSTVSTLSLSTTALNDSNQLAFQYALATGASGVALATIQSAPTGTPFQQWAAVKQLTAADALATADPDSDGRTNLEEFAFDGDPKSGATGGKRRADFASDGGSSYFTLTVPVRSGAVFSGTPPAATVDGVTYTVLADDDLSGSDLSAIRRDPIAAGLPALTGYDYQSFRLTTTAAQSPRAILRIRVSQAPAGGGL